MRALLALTAIAVLVAPAALAGPSPTTNWFSLINTSHANPTGMTVIVVPPAYFSYEAMVDDLSWVSPDALYTDPGTQAALEAIEYWAWMLDQHTSTHSQLAYVTFTAKVLGYDATPADLLTADIVVNTAMVSDPIGFIFHLGLGLPTLPATSALFTGGYMTHCTVWNTGLGSTPSDTEPIRLRNLIIHEFGHCLAAGHTGTSLGLAHCDSAGTCYDNHPTDVMSEVHGASRQCLSNLNVQSVAEAYAWAPGLWANHDGETYMLKSAYDTDCMPASMNRF